MTTVNRGRRLAVVAIVVAVLVGVLGIVVVRTVRDLSRTSVDVARDVARDQGDQIQKLLSAQVPVLRDQDRVTTAVRETVRNHGEVLSVDYADGRVETVVAVTGQGSAGGIAQPPRVSATVCFRYVRAADGHTFSATELDACP